MTAGPWAEIRRGLARWRRRDGHWVVIVAIVGELLLLTLIGGYTDMVRVASVKAQAARVLTTSVQVAAEELGSGPAPPDTPAARSVLAFILTENRRALPTGVTGVRTWAQVVPGPKGHASIRAWLRFAVKVPLLFTEELPITVTSSAPIPT